MNRNYFIIASIILLAGIILVFFVYRYINKPPANFENEEASVSIKAVELFNEYKSKADTANARYLGKVIEIQGYLTAIEKVDSMFIVVFAFDEGMFGAEGLRCTLLEKYHQQALDYTEGDEIALKGYCTGYNETDVIIEKCIIL